MCFDAILGLVPDPVGQLLAVSAIVECVDTQRFVHVLYPRRHAHLNGVGCHYSLPMRDRILPSRIGWRCGLMGERVETTNP